MINVQVARTGGSVVDLELDDDATVEEAISEAGLSVTPANRIRVNGITVNLEEDLEDGDIVTITGKVESGC